MLEKLLLPEIRELIANKDEETLRETLNRWPPSEVVELFADLSDEDDLAGVWMFSFLTPETTPNAAALAPSVAPGLN